MTRNCHRCRPRPDAVLFYYVGHGLLIDGGSQLGMAVSGTKSGVLTRENTSLLLNSVRKVLRKLDCGTKIEILDCCYSGIATNALGGARSLADEVRRAATTDAKGLYTVTAARYNEAALYSPGDDGLTYFTGFLKEVLHEGVNGPRRRLTMEDVFDGLLTRFTGLDDEYLEQPEPTQVNFGIANRFKFARNTAFLEDGTVPVPEPEGNAGTVQPDTQPKWARRAVLATAASATVVGVGNFAAWAHGQPPPSAQPGSQNTTKTHPAATTSTTNASAAGSAAATQSSVSADPHHFTKAVPVAGSPLTLGGPGG